MEIVLINPGSNIRKSLSGMRKLFSYAFPSLGLAYIAAVLEQNKVKVTVIDQFIRDMSNSAVLKEIEQRSPAIVGFSCLTHNMGAVKEMAARIRGLAVRPKIVLGNTHAALFAEDLLREGFADMIVRSEGEYGMLEIVNALRQNADLGDIKGISFIHNGMIRHNPDREPIMELDNLPYPAWHLFDLSLYPPSLLNGPALPIRTSRGCPHHCYFCVQDRPFKIPRLRSVKKVVDEIEHMRNKFNINNFLVFDSYFPFNLKYGFDFCKELIDRGLNKKIKWAIEARVDALNFELLKVMKEAGLRLILYGFEAGNQEVLDRLGKETALAQARKIAKETKKAGIPFQGLFILGMPGETRKTCEETIRFAKELGCTTAKFNLAMPFPGSKFYEDYKDKIPHIIKHPEKFDSWHLWSSYSGEPVFAPEGMTGKELAGLQRKAMLQFYMRPRWIIDNIISKRTPLKYLLCGACVLMSDSLKSIVCKTE